MRLAALFLVGLTICSVTWAFPSGVNEAEGRHDNMEERGPYFEGDLDISDDEIIKLKAGLIDPVKKWPNAVIYYKISEGFAPNESEIIRNATRFISDVTCIVLTELDANSTQKDYVEVMNAVTGGGCSSQVGRRGGRQTINLEDACLNRPGTVAHEFIHALGFYHEQSRTDRDDFVNINWDNIQSGKEHNFDLHTAAEVSPYRVPYDYGSVMHYSEYAFADDTEVRTIIPVQAFSGQIGQRLALSESDADKLKNMYGCP